MRFTDTFEGFTNAVKHFTESISFDKSLYKHDIMGSKAHASVLPKQGFIIVGIGITFMKGLRRFRGKLRTDREDVHMNIEVALEVYAGVCKNWRDYERDCQVPRSFREADVSNVL